MAALKNVARPTSNALTAPRDAVNASRDCSNARIVLRDRAYAHCHRLVVRLGDLRAEGVLTEAEFQAQKAKLLKPD